MRIMGLDYGSKTVGVAVSDPLKVTAQGIETIQRKSEGKLRQTLARIQELAGEYQVGGFVLGFPKNMDNTEGERCEKTLEFKELLEKRCGMPVVLWDERGTTLTAARYLNVTDTRGKKRKAALDPLSATIILESYLAWRKNHPEEEC